MDLNQMENKKSNKIKHVQFNLTPIVIYENPHESFFLHQARLSNFIEKQIDKLRIEKILNPILSIEHRKKIFEKLFKI